MLFEQPVLPLQALLPSLPLLPFLLLVTVVLGKQLTEYSHGYNFPMNSKISDLPFFLSLDTQVFPQVNDSELIDL